MKRIIVFIFLGTFLVSGCGSGSSDKSNDVEDVTPSMEVGVGMVLVRQLDLDNLLDNLPAEQATFPLFLFRFSEEDAEAYGSAGISVTIRPLNGQPPGQSYASVMQVDPDGTASLLYFPLWYDGDPNAFVGSYEISVQLGSTVVSRTVALDTIVLLAPLDIGEVVGLKNGEPSSNGGDTISVTWSVIDIPDAPEFASYRVAIYSYAMEEVVGGGTVPGPSGRPMFFGVPWMPGEYQIQVFGTNLVDAWQPYPRTLPLPSYPLLSVTVMNITF